MGERSGLATIIFSGLGHAYTHMFTAFYFVIVLALEDDWSLPYHELIALWTLGALLVGLGALPAGWIADRWSAPGMMLVFFVGLGVFGIVCGLVDEPSALLLGLSGIGLFASIYHPVGIAWLVRSVPRRGLALGVNGVFGPAGIAAASLGAGALIDGVGWRAAFIVPGVVSLATAVAFWACWRKGWLRDAPGQVDSRTPPSRGDVIRVYAILLLTMVVMGLVFQATQTALPKILDLRIRSITGEGAFGIGAIVACVYLVGGAMQIVGGHLADRVPLKPLYLLGFALQVPVLTLFAVSNGAPLLGFAVLAVILTSATLPAENLLLSRYTPAAHQSLAFGVKFVLAFCTGPLAIQFVSFIEARTGEFELLFLSLAGVAASAAIASTLLPGERAVAAPT